MKTPQLLTLDASKGAVGDVLLCQAIIGHMNRKLAAQIPKHGEALDRLASRPQAELLQAVSRKVRPTDPYRVLHKRHGQRFRFGGTPRAPACFA
jgi:hypothetical protein